MLLQLVFEIRGKLLVPFSSVRISRCLSPLKRILRTNEWILVPGIFRQSRDSGTNMESFEGKAFEVRSEIEITTIVGSRVPSASEWIPSLSESACVLEAAL